MRIDVGDFLDFGPYARHACRCPVWDLWTALEGNLVVEASVGSGLLAAVSACGMSSAMDTRETLADRMASNALPWIASRLPRV